MNIKQKVTMIVAAFALMTGVSSLALTTLQGQTAFAYTMDEDCGKYSSVGEEDACKKFQAGSAEECEGEDCCGDVKTSIIKDSSICDASDEEGGMIFAILKAVLKFLTAGVGIAAVGGIGYGALLYTTAESKPEQTKKAIGIITNVVIGIVAYALMYVFLNFLIPGGIFS